MFKYLTNTCNKNKECIREGEGEWERERERERERARDSPLDILLVV